MKKTYTKRKKLPTSFSLDAKIIKELTKLAKGYGKSKSWVVAELISQAHIFFNKEHD